jgi:hypothetical protein
MPRDVLPDSPLVYRRQPQVYDEYYNLRELLEN